MSVALNWMRDQPYDVTSMQISIPDSIIQSIRLPEHRIEQALLKELAVSLYQQELLSLGKARELAQMDYRDFSTLLGERDIPRHYTEVELDEDLTYAHC
jgi:predicted HTH domain antitoxin